MDTDTEEQEKEVDELIRRVSVALEGVERQRSERIRERILADERFAKLREAYKV